MTAALLALLAPTAAAQIAVPPAGTTEEIVVFGDPFARWDDTRWWVQTAFVNPLGVDLHTDDGVQTDVGAMQLTAVLECDVDGKLGPNRREVLCRIEDVGVQAIALRDGDPLGPLETALDEVDAKLTGATLQLQVDAKGGVTNVDLEGVTSRNRRQRYTNEQLRQVLLSLVATFHLRVEPGQTWEETGSASHQLPSNTGSFGASRMVHTVGQTSGHWVLQTIGEGTASVPLQTDATAELSANLEEWMAAKQSGNEVIVRLMANNTAPKVLADANGDPIEGRWSLQTHGVGVVDPDLGYVVERVMVTTGTAQPSNPVQAPLWVQGNLRLLDPDEHPGVGPTTAGMKP